MPNAAPPCCAVLCSVTEWAPKTEQQQKHLQQLTEEEEGKAPDEPLTTAPDDAPERTNAPFLKLVEEMERWGLPDHAVHFLKLVLISRGAAKVHMIDDFTCFGGRVYGLGLRVGNINPDNTDMDTLSFPQALWIVDEAKSLHKGLELVDVDLRETLAELKQLPGSQPIIQELKVST